jgi:Mg2+-importing ATPase
MDEEYLARPRKWDAGDIGRFMVRIGPVSSIFDLTTFALMWWVFGANSAAHQSLFQTGWFIEGLLSQTLIVHLIRTRKIPFVQSIAAAPVMTMTLAIMGVGVLIPFTMLGAKLGMSAPPPTYFAWLAGTLVCYWVFTQVVKRVYMRRYGSWL